MSLLGGQRDVAKVLAKEKAFAMARGEERAGEVNVGKT